VRILIGVDNYCAHYYINMGMARALTYTGHEVVMWDIHKKPTYDAFDEFRPDLLIYQSYNITDAIINCIEERPNLKVIMKAGDWGSYADTLDRAAYPILYASEKERRDVQELYIKTGRPNFLYIHYHPNWQEQTHGYWVKAGHKVVNLMNAADVFTYCNGKALPEFKSDIAFVGGYWGYKSKNLDKFLLPLCDKKLNIKIFGNQPWPVSQYCGFIDEVLVRDIFSSAKICPNISEPHSTDLGFDVIERPFKLLSAKAFVISDDVEGLRLLYPNEIAYANTPEQFFAAIDYYLGADQERKEMSLEGYYKTIKEHTYFERCSQMFEELELPAEAENIKKAKEKVVKELNL
jgi:hypothetical protein